MQRMSAREAKNAFGRLIDMARAEPVAIEKHGRPVVVVVALEEYERLIANRTSENLPSDNIKKSEGEG
jgi:prevent-host-death family protein